jgi:hypothetical protein
MRIRPGKLAARLCVRENDAPQGAAVIREQGTYQNQPSDEAAET